MCIDITSILFTVLFIYTFCDIYFKQYIWHSYLDPRPQQHLKCRYLCLKMLYNDDLLLWYPKKFQLSVSGCFHAWQLPTSSLLILWQSIDRDCHGLSSTLPMYVGNSIVFPVYLIFSNQMSFTLDLFIVELKTWLYFTRTVGFLQLFLKVGDFVSKVRQADKFPSIWRMRMLAAGGFGGALWSFINFHLKSFEIAIFERFNVYL